MCVTTSKRERQSSKEAKKAHLACQSRPFTTLRSKEWTVHRVHFNDGNADHESILGLYERISGIVRFFEEMINYSRSVFLKISTSLNATSEAYVVQK